MPRTVVELEEGEGRGKGVGLQEQEKISKTISGEPPLNPPGPEGETPGTPFCPPFAVSVHHYCPQGFGDWQYP